MKKEESCVPVAMAAATTKAHVASQILGFAPLKNFDFLLAKKFALFLVANRISTKVKSAGPGD